MQGNEELRGHVATALIILCFKVDSMRHAFIREGALDSTLSMLKHLAGRNHALDFLCTLDPLVLAAIKEITQLEDDSGVNLTNPYAAAAASKSVASDFNMRLSYVILILTPSAFFLSLSLSLSLFFNCNITT